MAYGLQVYNQSGTTIIDENSRVIRYHSVGTVSVPINSYVDVTVAGMANDDSWTVLISYRAFLWFTAEGSYVKSTNKVRFHHDEATSPFIGSNPTSLTIDYIIVRT